MQQTQLKRSHRKRTKDKQMKLQITDTVDSASTTTLNISMES